MNSKFVPVVMAHALDEIVWLDRCWFGAHPKRQHRCRWPDPRELDLCDCDLSARLVIAIRHLGRGHLVYQPVIFRGALAAHEKSAASLFALAATSREPIPVVSEADLPRPRHGRRKGMELPQGLGTKPLASPSGHLEKRRDH
jgi:hypothetical protein